MLIILFFGFGLLAYGAWYLKRRYHRRREAEISRSQPDLGSWGPGRSVHDFGTTGEAPRPPFNEKGKEPERVDIPMQTQALETTKGSKRLKKSWLPGRH